MEWYVALLRGINVGGRNKIAMVDLRTCFEEMGFVGVRTYIQSGNVVFGTEERDKRKLGERVEAGLSERFGFEIRVALRSQAEMAAVLASAPEGLAVSRTSFVMMCFF